MSQTPLHRAFAPIRRRLPAALAGPLRSAATAFLTPLLFAWRSGHFRSSFANRAVAPDGAPLPWYTYPCIDFLRFRDYAARTVLEFGAGQSTLWWSARAKRVVAFEGDEAWCRRLRPQLGGNVDLLQVSMASADACLADIQAGLARLDAGTFDVVVIDGLYRAELIGLARQRRAPDGIIVCDNAEGYGFHAGFRDSGLGRVDFYGYTPGTVLPHATSIFFDRDSFVFDPAIPIADVGRA